MGLGLRFLPLVAEVLLAMCFLRGTADAFVLHTTGVLPSLGGRAQRVHRHRDSSYRTTRLLPTVVESSRCGEGLRRQIFASEMFASPRTSRCSGKRGNRTALLMRSGGDGEGPGTKQLSRQAKLAISVLIDIIGVWSYALPGVGEASDVAWAPISSALIFFLYGNSIFAGLAFVEEILPGFDVIPTATIAWFLTNSEVGKNVTNAAGKTGGPTEKKPSSASPPPSSPSVRANASESKWGSRKVDGDSVLSGVIDVDSEE